MIDVSSLLGGKRVTRDSKHAAGERTDPDEDPFSASFGSD